MSLLRPGAYALVLMVILSGIGIAWGAQTVAMASKEHGEVVVDWERMRVDESDVVRIWIRNAGETELQGSPRIMVLNENGGVQQSFAFGQFVIELDPDESVYVDWTLGSVHRCFYGTLDSSGAPSDLRSPCVEPMVGDVPQDIAAPGCYGCYVPPMISGKFVAVGVFGEHADAAVLDLR